MAVTRTLLYSFVVLAISHQITAQQGFGWQFPSYTGSLGGFQVPSFLGLGSGGSSPNSEFFTFPFNFLGFLGLGGSHTTSTEAEASSTTAASDTTTTPIATSTAAANSDPQTRKRRAANHHEEQPEHQNRLFFSAFPTITSCNFTTQAGASCPSCTQALRCLPNNVGILTRCRGLFRHCNNGRCSLTQSAACASTTTTASTTAATESTTGTSSTTSSTTASTSATESTPSTTSSTTESTAATVA